MSAWPVVRIADIAEKVVIGPFGSRMKADLYVPSGVPVIRGTNLTGGRVLAGEWVFVPAETADELSNCNTRAGDLVFPHRGAIGEVGLVPGDRDRYMLSTSLMMLRCAPQKAVPEYLYYYFKSHQGRYELLKNASQVGTPGIGQPLTSLRAIELPLPPLPLQRQVAATLSSLDDKIELNRRMSQTLEAIAKAIFKSWFVDFEHDWPAADWETKPLDAVADFLNGLALQKYPPADDEDTLPVIKIAQLRAGHTKSADRAGLNVPEAYVINDGDLLFSWSGSLEVDFWCGGRGALNQHLFKVSSQLVPPWYAYFWTKQHLPEFRAIAANKATTMGHIQRKHLTAAEVLLPPPAVLESMDKVMHPLIATVIQLRLEARTLAELRDELLPKLLSGELTPNSLAAPP